MADNIKELLDANKNELDALLRKYELLEKTHKNLIENMKNNVQTVNEFYEKDGSIIENVAMMTTNAKRDVLDFKRAMEEVLKEMNQVNGSLDQLSAKYSTPKEEIAKVIPLLREWVKIHEEVESLEEKRRSQGGILSEEEEARLNDCQSLIEKRTRVIEKMGHSAKKILKDYKESGEDIKNHIKYIEKLDDAIADSTDAQERYSNSVEIGSARGNKWSLFGNVFSSLWNTGKQIAKAGAKKWLEVDQSAHDFGRNMGMSARDINAHTASLFQNYGSLAKQLGMEFKDIYKFQTGYTEATERAVILTKEQVGTMAALSRNTGDEAISVASKNLDVFTTSANAAIDYLAKGVARASMDGLNVKKFSEHFANNIKMASKYTFREGVTGIQKMTLLSQKLKFNMESIGTAMDKFSTLEGAMEASAKLQVLGGSFAQNFGNPLEAMSEALLDGEAFTKRIIDSVANTAKFNEKTGELDLAPIDKQRLKSAADAMGISYDELHNMATQSRKTQLIDSAVKGSGLSEEQKSYLVNKAQYNQETGKWHLTDASGKMLEKDISQMTGEEIDAARNTDSYEKIIAADVNAIHTLFVDKANQELSENDRIKGWQENLLLTIGSWYEEMPSWFQWIVSALMNSQLIGGIFDLVGGGLKGVFKHGGKLLSKGSKLLGGFGSKVASAWKGGMKGSVKSIGSGATKWITKGTSATAKYVARPLSKVVRGGSKLLGKMATPLAVGLTAWEVGDAIHTYEQNRKAIVNEITISGKEKAKALNDAAKQRNKQMGGAIGGLAGGILGAILGSIILPGIGTVIGGGLGGWGGYEAGSEIGRLVTETPEETYERLRKEGYKEDINAAEGYIEEGEWASSPEATEEEEMKTNVKAIEKQVQGVNEKLGVTNGLLSSTNISGGGSVKTDVKTNQNTTISVSDMKMNMSGEIKLTTDYNAGHIDVGKLFQDIKFQNSLKEFMAQNANILPGSNKPANQNSTAS